MSTINHQIVSYEKMILLHPNTKRRESGERCHPVTMMHRKSVKTFKMNANQANEPTHCMSTKQSL
jgi:hypothetical protein